METDSKQSNRRQLLKAVGLLGAAAIFEGEARAEQAALTSTPAATGFREEIERNVAQTTIVDTHEHLPEEHDRLQGGLNGFSDDWSFLFSLYIDSDLVVAGMPQASLDQLKSRSVDPAVKWSLIAPYWPAVKNTGYGRMVRIAIRELYGIEELNEKAIPRLQQGYEAIRKPGFYQKILVDAAKIESCQVDSGSFTESRQPALLMQDLSILGMHWGPDLKTFGEPTGKEIRDLSDWHGVIRWWFDKYGPYAVAVKSQAAYYRGLDYDQVPAEKAEPVFRKVVRSDPVSPQEKKLLEDHLFWFAVGEATTRNLPVKLHTGYYYNHDEMPLGRVAGNPAEAADLCRKSPQTQFVFMHVAYPYWQEMIAVAKHYTNAYIDMCWAWIIDPAAAVRFLKSCLVTAPSNKVLTFGGDLFAVECVLGHVRIAREGIVRALGELVDENWISRNDALELIEPLLHGNARRVFHLDAKLERLRKAPWL